MSIFDVFKKKSPSEIRGYEIHDVSFCEVGADGKRHTEPSQRQFTNSRYIIPVVKLTALRNETVTMGVRLCDPHGNRHKYFFEVPLTTQMQNIEYNLGGWGSEDRTKFNIKGRWTWEILDSEGNIVFLRSMNVVDIDEIWEEQGWIFVDAMDFVETDFDGNELTSWGYGPFKRPKYIQARFRYTGLASEVKNVKYTAVITNVEHGWHYELENDLIPVYPDGGTIYLQGFGSNEGDAFPSGKYNYAVMYNGKVIAQQDFTVEKTPAEKGWIEPVAAAFLFYNDTEYTETWLYTQGLKAVSNHQAITEPEKYTGGNYEKCAVAFQYVNLEGWHDVKLTFKFYYNDRNVLTKDIDIETKHPGIPESSSYPENTIRLVGSLSMYDQYDNVIPLRSGKYTVKIYLSTSEIDQLHLLTKTIRI